MNKVIIALLIPPVFIGSVVGLFLVGQLMPLWALWVLVGTAAWGWVSYIIWWSFLKGDRS